MKTEEYPSVEKWLSGLADGSYETQLGRFSLFLNWLRENGGEFADMSPDELIVYAEDATKKEQYKLLDVVQAYIKSLKGLRGNTLKSRYSAIRSFFAHNRAELPKDPNFKIRPDVPPVEGTLTPENIRDVARASNLTYRAAFLCMFQSGMGRDEFIHWNLNGCESLQKDLRENKPFITVRLPGRKSMKNEKPYKTFIGGDAKAALLKYLPYRELASEKFDGSRREEEFLVTRGGNKYVEKKFNLNAIFYSSWGTPVSEAAIYDYWRRRLVALGVRIPIGDGDPTNRYGDNQHEMRDVFRSQWQKTNADKTCVEYMMGHTLDPLGYNKAYKDDAWVISELRKAMPMLNIMSSNLPFGLVSKEEYEAEVYNLQELLRIANEKIASFENDQHSSDSEISVVRS